MERFPGPARWPAEGGKKSVRAVGTPSADVAPTQVPEPEEPAGPDATDAAKALAAEHGIDLTTITGTGVDGRITKDDVAAQVPAPEDPEPEPPEPIPDEADLESAAETA